MRELRALTVFDRIPAGCILQPFINDDSAPHLRAGEFAVIDTADTTPQHREVYLIRWLSGQPSIVQLISRPFKHPVEGMLLGRWTRCLNFKPYDQALASARRAAPGAVPVISRRSYFDGPSRSEGIQQALIGRVIGVY